MVVAQDNQRNLVDVQVRDAVVQGLGLWPRVDEHGSIVSGVDQGGAALTHVAHDDLPFAGPSWHRGPDDRCQDESDEGEDRGPPSSKHPRSDPGQPQTDAGQDAERKWGDRPLQLPGWGGGPHMGDPQHRLDAPPGQPSRGDPQRNPQAGGNGSAHSQDRCRPHEWSRSEVGEQPGDTDAV